MSDDHSMKQQKTVDDIQLPTWNNIVKMLDLSTDNDWEKIARYFTRYFTLNDIARIKNDQRTKGAYSPSEAVLETLRNNLVPISRLYKCFVEFQLIAACNYLEEAFPAEILYKRSSSSNPHQAPAQTVPTSDAVTANAGGAQVLSNKSDQVTSVSQTPSSVNAVHDIGGGVKLVPIDHTKSHSPNRSVSMNMVTPTSATSVASKAASAFSGVVVGGGANGSISQMSAASQEQVQSASLQIISLFESIIPVINDTSSHEDQLNLASSINQFSANPSGAFDSTNGLVPNKFKLFGKFDIVHIQERRLRFLKREFNNPFDYIRELKMIKYKHANILSPECIFKSLTSFNYFLLYQHDVYQVNTLSEVALQNYTLFEPSQFNTIQQLTILRDLAAALTFLHDRHVDNQRILHGNLHPDNILVEFRGNDSYVAKISDFTSVIELNEAENNDAKIREEFYKFGLLIFLTVSWRYMEKAECDHIHNQKYEDKNLYQYSLFCQYQMNKQPNREIISTLFRMFFALTSSDYEVQKGIHKGYYLINDLLDKCQAEKSRWT